MVDLDPLIPLIMPMATPSPTIDVGVYDPRAIILWKIRSILSELPVGIVPLAGPSAAPSLSRHSIFVLELASLDDWDEWRKAIEVKDGRAIALAAWPSDQKDLLLELGVSVVFDSAPSTNTWRLLFSRMTRDAFARQQGADR